MKTHISTSKKATALSLIEIFKYDDSESLIKSNPEISISTFIPFCGRNLPVGAVAAAMHYRAINCLKKLPLTFETYGGKMGGPSAAHVACENQWEPGLQILIDAKVPLNTFDGNSKTPLAYVADHENVNFFRLFLKYFEDTNQVKNGLKNVALEAEGSLDFLSYCVENKKAIMIESCNYATKKGFITKYDIRNAIIKWKSKYTDEMPLFLRSFNDSFTLQDECAINNLFSPLVPTSKFAEINSPYSIPIYNVINKINELCEKSNIKVSNISERRCRFKEFNEFVNNMVKENFFTTHFSTYKVLKRYFNSFFNSFFKKKTNSNYFLPDTEGPFFISDCWKDFGTLLAHVAYTGFHYHFEYPLHPLIYTVLTLNNPKDIDNLGPEDIEQYFQVVKPNKIKGTSILEARKKGLEQFLKGDEFINQYNKSLNKSWEIEIRGYNNYLVNIHKGFYRDNQDQKFNQFLEEIKKLDVTTMRIWFEGIYYNNKLQFDISKQLNCKLFMRENDGGIIRANKFIQMFKEWMKECNPKDLINFLTALLGNKVLWPVESNYKTIFIISKPLELLDDCEDDMPMSDNQGDDDLSDDLPEELINEPIPYVIVPTQEAAIPILNSKDEINDLVMRALKYGQIGYVKREKLLEGLIPINLDVVL